VEFGIGDEGLEVGALDQVDEVGILRECLELGLRGKFFELPDRVKGFEFFGGIARGYSAGRLRITVNFALTNRALYCGGIHAGVLLSYDQANRD